MVCIYKGEKYSAFNKNGKIVICTYNGKKEGFTQMTVRGKIYVNYYERTLEPSEIESLYHEKICFQYRGEIFESLLPSSVAVDENRYWISTSDGILAEKYSFEGSYYEGFDKAIQLDEIERIIINRLSVTGFEEFFNVEETEVVEKENVKEWVKLAASLKPDPRDQEWP